LGLVSGLEAKGRPGQLLDLSQQPRRNLHGITYSRDPDPCRRLAHEPDSSGGLELAQEKADLLESALDEAQLAVLRRKIELEGHRVTVASPSLAFPPQHHSSIGGMAQDVAGLIGLLASLEGELMAAKSDDLPGWAKHLADRMSRDGLLTAHPHGRELRQSLNDLNHRLRYVLGEYDEEPASMPVP
jgi:hypothetical protein